MTIKQLHDLAHKIATKVYPTRKAAEEAAKLYISIDKHLYSHPNATMLDSLTAETLEIEGGETLEISLPEYGE